jgi:hypothetical protein
MGGVLVALGGEGLRGVPRLLVDHGLVAALDPLALVVEVPEDVAAREQLADGACVPLAAVDAVDVQPCGR